MSAQTFVPLPAQIGRIEIALSDETATEADRVVLRAVLASLRFLADHRDWIVPEWRRRVGAELAAAQAHPAGAALLEAFPEARFVHARPRDAAPPETTQDTPPTDDEEATP